MRAGFLMLATALGLSLATPAMGQSARGNRPVPALSAGQSAMGELTPLDNQRRSGKYEDQYQIQGRRGQRIELRLTSDDFDPFLLVTGPGGYQISNDDGDSSSLNSRMVIELPADGTYRVSATSFEPGSMGAYRIEARQASGNARVEQPIAAASLAIGQAVDGRLDQRDTRLGEDKFQDRYRLTGRRGDRVRIELASSEFDTVLSLQGPDGTVVSNDDMTGAQEGNTNSRLDTVLAEDGDYIVTVTSYAENGTGKYRLAMAPRPDNPRHAGLNGGRVLLVAVGVSDYERMSGLPHTDDDATELGSMLRNAGLLHPSSAILTNAQATKARVRDALRRAATAAGPNDLVMFFFSGHGDQVDAQRGARELDGKSETIELYDAAMSDAELQPLIDQLRGRMVMVALDSCFSGGFRNLVDRPNVMGLFSSEEDLTSMVASRYDAGGYLSYYLRTGLGGDADNDGDRVITAGELSTYLRRNFRMQGDIPASTNDDENDYQYLIVERGGIAIQDGVLRLAQNNVRQASMSQFDGGKPDAEEAETEQEKKNR